MHRLFWQSLKIHLERNSIVVEAFFGMMFSTSKTLTLTLKLQTSCRSYCALMRMELKDVLVQSPDTDGTFFQLFRAAHHLEEVAAKHCSLGLSRTYTACCEQVQL